MPSYLHIMNYVPQGTRTFDQFVLAIAVRAKQEGWSARFVLASAPAEVFADRARHNGIEWICLPMPWSWASFRQLKAAWPGYRPDCVVTSFISVFTWPLISLKLTRYARRLIVCDDSSGAVHRQGWPLRLLRRIRGRLVGRFVDIIRPVSHFVAQREVQDMYLPKNKINMVWNGIDAGRFPYHERKIHETLRIAFAGQLIPEKGVQVLLDALCHLKQRGISFAARIAGTGAAESALRARALSLGLHERECEFLGHINNVSELFAWADLVVIPSLWAEAFGYVAAEAMSTGAVVVVSDAGGLPEVVGEAGVVVPAGDTGALADQMVMLAKCRNERIRLGRLASQRVQDVFLLSTAAEQMVELIVSQM